MIEMLNEREGEILALMAQGMTNQEIADRLHLAVTTVKWYNTQIYEKLAVKNRKQAVSKARSDGLLVAHQTDVPSTRSNLPKQVTPFIGREEEIRALGDLLGTAAIITVLGPGGMGKTRLAVEVAARYADQFQQGAYFVGLAPLSNPDAIVAAIIEALNFPLQQGLTSPEDQLLEYLEKRSLLLILDNFEHLLAGAPVVGRVVRAAPGVTVLVTSRERLNITGETVFTLTGLTFPEWNAPDDALGYDAVRLFVQGARRIRPDFEITPDDLDDMARICRLTAGMPLGIELAAGWTDTLTLSQIADEIKAGIDILETELRDVPDRHRSIRATIDYSWKGLSEAERAAFVRLAVFRGGFDAGGAEAVAGANRRILRKLVNKALVYSLPEGRYLIHELLRQYGEERLRVDGIYEATRHAHADFYITLMVDNLNYIKALSGRRLVDRDFDNVLTAWHWLVVTHDYMGLEQLMEPLWTYLSHHGRNYDGIPLFEWTLEQLQPDADDTHQQMVYGALMQSLAELTLGVNPARGYDLLDQAQAILEPLGPSDYLLWNLMLRGNVFYENGLIPLDEREIYMRKSLDMARSLKAEVDIPIILQVLGTIAMYQEDTATARRLGLEALEAATALNDVYAMAMARGLLGHVDYYSGDYESARQHMLVSLEAVENVGHLYSISRTLIRLWKIAHKQGKVAEARQYVASLIRWHQDYGQDWQLLGALAGIAEHWFLEVGDYEHGVELVALVMSHPFTSNNTRNDIQMANDTLKSKLDEATYQAAYERGANRVLMTAVNQLLTELSSYSPRPSK